MLTHAEIQEVVVEREQEWFVFLENREAVIAALQEGCCDRILPAARSFLDGFAGFCLDAGILAAIDFSGRGLPVKAGRGMPRLLSCTCKQSVV
jgi:hypothetical protein